MSQGIPITPLTDFSIENFVVGPNGVSWYSHSNCWKEKPKPKPKNKTFMQE